MPRLPPCCKPFGPLRTRRQLLALAGAWLPLAAQAQPTALAGAGLSRNQITVGQVLSLESGRNEHGVAVRQGVEAALQVINANGGILGRQLNIRVLDDQAQPEQAQSQAQRLVDDGVFLLFGPIEGGPSTAVMGVARSNGVPLFAPMAGSPGLRRPHQPLVFPVRAEHRDEFQVLLSQAQGLGMRRTALMHADTEVGRQHLANAQAIATGLGMATVLGLPVPSAATDATLQNLVKLLREQRVEMLFNHGAIGLYERLIRQLRAGGLKLACWGVNSGASQLARHLGPLAQGMLFTQIVPSPWERKSALTREYQEAFRASFRDQPFSYSSLEGYVSTRALAEALRRAGAQPSRASFLAGLASADLDIAGYALRYRTGEHSGSSFVDTAIVTADGRFRH